MGKYEWNSSVRGGLQVGPLWAAVQRSWSTCPCGCLSNWVSVSLLQRKGINRRLSKVSVCPRIPLVQHTNWSLCKMVVIAVIGLSIIAARHGKAECAASQGSLMSVHLSWREKWLGFAECTPPPFLHRPALQGAHRRTQAQHPHGKHAKVSLGGTEHRELGRRGEPHFLSMFHTKCMYFPYP